MPARSLPLCLLLLAGCAASGTTLPEAAPAPALPPTAAQTPAMPAGDVPAAEDPRLHEIVTAASAARVAGDVRTLVDFSTRHTLSDTLSRTRGIGAARRWLFAEFERISAACGGCLEVQYVSEIIPGDTSSRIPRDTRVVDVVAIQRGRSDPQRFVGITGHYDSRVSGAMDSTSAAPGANDDASGVAAVLESARLLSRYPSDASIFYGALAGEEQGLFGGQILARHAEREGWRIEGLLNNDIVGGTEGINGVSDNTRVRVFAPGISPEAPASELRRFLYSGGELDVPSRQLARYAQEIAELYVPNLRAQVIYRLDRFGRGGDHTPFFLAGYPAVRITEPNENYNRQHQDLRTEDGIRYGDVPEKVDYPYLAKVASLNAATLASLAWAPAPPDSVTISGAVQPSTTLKWSAVRAPDLAGYRVYWREPTSATWDMSSWVGNVTETTLDNIVIDNYFFGVAAVDREGHESLVVFPYPGR